MKRYTYKFQSTAEDLKLDELMKELNNITWNVVGIRGIFRKGIQLKVIIYFKGKEIKLFIDIEILVDTDVVGNVERYSEIMPLYAPILIMKFKNFTTTSVELLVIHTLKTNYTFL